MTTYKREAVPGEDDAYKFTPYRILNDGKQSRIEFKNFLEQIEWVFDRNIFKKHHLTTTIFSYNRYSNDADDFVNDFINALKEGAIFDEYIFESPLSNASHFEFKLKKSKGNKYIKSEIPLTQKAKF